METRENLTQEEIIKLEQKSKEMGGKSIRLFTKDELLDIAENNHIWLDGFECINPSTKLAQALGYQVLKMLDHSEMRDFLGISKEIILTVNKS